MFPRFLSFSSIWLTGAWTLSAAVTMGEKFKIQDLRAIEKLADRIPLPESLAKELA